MYRHLAYLLQAHSITALRQHEQLLHELVAFGIPHICYRLHNQSQIEVVKLVRKHHQCIQNLVDEFLALLVL
jgi:hypothetical protein